MLHREQCYSFLSTLLTGSATEWKYPRWHRIYLNSSTLRKHLLLDHCLVYYSPRAWQYSCRIRRGRPTMSMSPGAAPEADCGHRCAARKHDNPARRSEAGHQRRERAIAALFGGWALESKLSIVLWEGCPAFVVDAWDKRATASYADETHWGNLQQGERHYRQDANF